MNLLCDSLARLARWALLAMALVLHACGGGGGPGSGGTGTGPVALSYTGSAGAVGGTGPVFIGSPSPALACTACTRADLRLEDALVELRLPCGRFSRTGPWDTQAAVVELAGTLETSTAGGAPASQPATLRLQFATSAQVGSPQVTVTLLGAQGVVLAGPLVLQRDAAAQPAPAVCSPGG